MNRVVIIDDEIQSRNGIAEIFRNHSPQWEIGGLFEDGSQALEYLLQHPEINLIVTDIRMPKFDGLELISRIRQYNKLIQSLLSADTQNSLMPKRQLITRYSVIL